MVGVVLLGMALTLITGCASAEVVPGDPEFDPLAQSSPAEMVARSLRLAGFEEMVVWLDGNQANAWVRIPAVNSAADVELAWQTAAASLAVAYPSAGEYAISIATDRDVLDITAPGDGVRTAVERDDPWALREAAEFSYVVSAESDELPGNAYDASGDTVHYLDQKNRSNGLLGDGSLLIEQADELGMAAEDAREAVPGVPAVPADADAGAVWAERTEALLDESGAQGAQELASLLFAQGTSATRESVSQTREWFHIASAVESDASYGSVLGLVADYTELTRDNAVTDGPQAHAVLVAFRDRSAPSSARVVTEFERMPTADTDGTGEADLLPDHVIEANGGAGAVIAYVQPSGTQVVETDVWLAYDRADGTRFWLAGEAGEVALTDGSVIGWAFERSEAALVDEMDVGARLGVFPTR